MNPVVDLHFIGLINEDTQVPRYIPLISYLHFWRTVSHLLQVLQRAHHMQSWCDGVPLRWRKQDPVILT